MFNDLTTKFGFILHNGKSVPRVCGDFSGIDQLDGNVKQEWCRDSLWVYYNKSTSEHTGQLRDFTVNKTKNVAWFVSNYNGNNNRLQYALELQNYIQVDMYGSSGTYTCSRSSEQSCFEILAESYKFYLALNNSNSVQYNTKQFFFNSSGNNCTSKRLYSCREFLKPKTPRRLFSVYW